MFFSRDEILKIGFKSVGENVLISDRARFFRPERISIGNNVRIDDDVVIANNVTINNYVHISIGVYLLSSPNAYIEMKDFTGISYGSLIFTSSDNYFGACLTNPTVPSRYRDVVEKPVILNKHCLVGAKSTVAMGVVMGEGSTAGAMSLIAKSTKPWKFYFGNPAKPYFDRPKEAVLKLEEDFKNSKEYKEN